MVTLRGASREAYLAKQVAQLQKTYKAAQQRLTLLLARTDLTDFSRARANQMLKQIEQINLGLTKDARKWAIKSLSPSYERGIDIAGERLRAMGITRFVSNSAQVHTQAIEILVDDVTAQLAIANDGMKNFMNRFIRSTQQKILEDKRISELIAQGLIQGDTRQTVSDALLNEMRKKIANQGFISINGRNYRPDAYARLVARTRTREATTQGSINTALRYGVDLVQIDTHSEICPYCQQFSGRVYTISGSDKRFPRLKERPPFHPNCRCVPLPVTIEALEERGHLEGIIKLSNSPTTKIDSYKRFEAALEELS